MKSIDSVFFLTLVPGELKVAVPEKALDLPMQASSNGPLVPAPKARVAPRSPTWIDSESLYLQILGLVLNQMGKLNNCIVIFLICLKLKD